MKKLIVGLGNIGKEYEFTRHNIGFIFLDYLVEKLGLQFITNKKLESSIASNNSCIFCKPLTYMNLSGNAVKNVSNFYKIKNENIVVVHDDIESKIGEIKKVFNQEGAQGNNGIRSIHSVIGKNFTRIKIGVGKNLLPNQSVADYVLSNFTKEELELIKNKFDDIIEILDL